MRPAVTDGHGVLQLHLVTKLPGDHHRLHQGHRNDGGIRDFVTFLHSQGTKDALHKKVIYLEDEGDVGEVEVALQWNQSYQESLLSFGEPAKLWCPLATQPLPPRVETAGVIYVQQSSARAAHRGR